MVYKIVSLSGQDFSRECEKALKTKSNSWSVIGSTVILNRSSIYLIRLTSFLLSLAIWSYRGYCSKDSGGNDKLDKELVRGGGGGNGDGGDYDN
jgi:hypothetical protein